MGVKDRRLIYVSLITLRLAGGGELAG